MTSLELGSNTIGENGVQALADLLRRNPVTTS